MKVHSTKSFDLSFKSFLPGGKWTPCVERENFQQTTIPMWIKDSLSQHVYLNQPTDVLRIKLSILTGLLAPMGNAVSLGLNAGYRVLKVVTLSHYWLPLSVIASKKEGGEKGYNLKTRSLELAKDIARFVATPFAWIGLFFASWGGVIDPRENAPRDASKIYSSIEIAMYGGTMELGHFGWAPCYQPEADSHAFGGNINQQIAF